MEDSYIIDKIRTYCNQNNIKTNGVLVIKIEINRVGEFTSLVIDFDNNVILPNYPIQMLDSYNEKQVGDLLICYKDGLQLSGFNDNKAQVDVGNNDKPFCCNLIEPYIYQKLDKEIYFTDFINKRGSHKDVVYEVKRQINNGPLISTKYYKLLNGEYQEVDKGNSYQKIHAFKNYICETHKLFFMVDLYSDNPGVQIYNHHHMRLNPVTHKNEEVLNLLFNKF